MYAHVKLLRAKAMGLLQLAQSLPIGATPPRTGSVRTATQYRHFVP
jgi:hypothetical protein